MPSRWFIPILGADPTQFRSDHLHAAITQWFDKKDGTHNNNEKPYSISDLRVGTNTPGRPYGVEIGILNTDAEQHLRAAITAAAPLQLGRVHGRVGSPRLIHEATWETLTAPTPTQQWTLLFQTPVTFHPNNRYTPLPNLRTVLDGLDTIWNTWGDAPLEHVQSAKNAAWVSDIQLRSVGHTIVIQRAPLKISGALGTMTIRCDKKELAPAVGSLLKLASYSGIGAQKLRGLGVTRVHEHRTTP